ncbi:MAG: phosphoribosylformylglycinamidine cyclo-ligase [Thermodesulfobacteriota bacterium]
MEEPLTYEDTGVSIDKAKRWVEEVIKPLAKTTHRSEVKSGIGGFGGMFGLRADKYQNPVLVATTDGVGTKLKVAFMVGKHDTVGIDLVAMCVNDLVVQGAEPLFFLDYFALGELEGEIAVSIMQGIVAGCKEAGCSLIGGETAQMPSFYAAGEYDLAGFAVGIVENDKIIDGSGIKVGNRVIGIASSGLHSNGYSLARKVLFDKLGLKVDQVMPELGCTLGEELLKPTKIYVRTALNLVRDCEITGVAHITGGGIVENLDRILPKGCKAAIIKDSWEIPPIFKIIQDGGNLPPEEMWRTFNNGIGMAVVCPQSQVEDIISRLTGLGEKGFLIGRISRRQKGDGKVEIT